MAGGDDFYCFCHLKNNYTTVRCSTEHHYCSIRKLVRLLETTDPEQQLDRKQILLNDFLVACSYGFWMCDIPFICRVVELFIEKKTYLLHFCGHLERILYLFAIPPMLACSSEVLKCKKDLKEYFNFLGYILTDPNEKYNKILVLRALWCLLDNNIQPRKCCVPLDLRHAIVGESIVAEFVAEMLRFVPEDDYSLLLKFALLLSEVSETAGSTLVTNGVIGVVMLRMDPNWCRRDKYYPPMNSMNVCFIANCDVALKLLWVLLKSLKNRSIDFLEKIEPLDQNCLWSFRYVFQMILQTKHCELERNHSLAILLLCLQYLTRSSFVSSGLIFDIAKICIQTEIDIGTQEVRLTSSDGDFQFKKMALIALYCSANNNSALSIYRDLKIIKQLLKLIMPRTKVIWNTEQQKKLTIITVGVFQRFVCEMKNEFSEEDVISRLLVLVGHYSQNSYDLEVLLALLKCLYFVTVHLALAVNYAIETTITDLTVSLLSQKQFLLIHHKCLNYCFSILSTVREKQNTSNLRMVEVGFEYMRKSLNLTPEDFSCDPTTMICLLDLLWNGLLTNEENMNCFVKLGCAYTLLDLINKSIFPVKLIGLGLLTDLCEEGSCIPHLLTWRGKGKTLIPLLMSIFRMECKMVRVKIDENGILEDVEMPLMGVRQHAATKHPNKNPNSSPATVDFILSVRPKIYAILQLLKYRHKDVVELVNEHYRLQNETLYYKDQITKLLAENYLQFKLGEVWCEINIDLQNIGLKPLEVDGRSMETLVRKHYHLSMMVKEIQEEILKHKFREDKIDEYMIYRMLKESKLCSALCALKELDYIARVSEHMIRHLKKSIQKLQVERSLSMIEVQNVHPTLMRNIGVTNVYGLTANIESDINEKKMKSDVCVSSAGSDATMDENSVSDFC